MKNNAWPCAIYYEMIWSNLCCVYLFMTLSCCNITPMHLFSYSVHSEYWSHTSLMCILFYNIGSNAPYSGCGQYWIISTWFWIGESSQLGGTKHIFYLCYFRLTSIYGLFMWARACPSHLLRSIYLLLDIYSIMHYDFVIWFSFMMRLYMRLLILYFSYIFFILVSCYFSCDSFRV